MSETLKPAAPVEMAEAVRAAINEIRAYVHLARSEGRLTEALVSQGIADALEAEWRDHSRAVGITPELERVLSGVAAYGKLIGTRSCEADVAAVRSQYANAQPANGGKMSADTAWLIEHIKDPRYGRESWYSGKDGFTIDSLQAVRFARKEDAVREIDRFPATLAKNLIAAHHSWIPARVCPHGQLQRQCEICEATEEAAHWRNKAENAFEPIRKIADALAQGGFHCHDKPGFVADHVPSLVNEAVTELKIKREECERLRQANQFDVRRLSALYDNEKVLRVRAEDAAKMEASDLRARLNQLGDSWRLIGESLREFGYEPTGEDQWVALVHRALARVAELEAAAPKWVVDQSLEWFTLKRAGWEALRQISENTSGSFVSRSLMVPPIPLPEGSAT